MTLPSFSAAGFSVFFLAAWSITLFLRLWLAHRQLRAVSAHKSHVPAQFVDSVSMETHARAADYTLDKTRFARWNTLSDALLLLVLTVGGGIGVIATLTEGVPGGTLWQGVALLLLVMLVFSLVDLPFAFHRQFSIEARYGFNRMTPRLFFADLGKQLLLALLIGAPLMAAALALMQMAGTGWWLWLWALWAAFNLLALWLYPTLIAPLFNRFEPLRDEALAQRIHALLARCGFRSGGLFVMDGSKRSAHGNAYFTGFGAQRRIVFFDTLLEKLSPDQVEAVLAHELGHFHHRHIAKRLTLGILTTGAFLWLLSQLREAEWFFSGLGVSSMNDASALLLFMLVLPVVLFPLSPFGSWLSRRDEFEADRYAVAHSSAEHLASALIQLYKDNAATLTPDPLHSLFYDSHPPAAERLQKLRDLS